ncbi:MAG: hypothetical protein WCQ95_02075 [Bacteroidota bacterium]
MQKFKNKLSAEKVQKLNDANFEWYFFIPDRMEFYNEFLELKKQSNNVIKERNNPVQKKTIYEWIQEQRDKKELLSPEYIQKLNEANFDWG